MPFAEVLKTLPKDAGLCSKISNYLCPFTSRSRLFALTTDLPGPADGPLNIVQGNILASWSQNQNPFRMSEGDESDGNLGVLLIRTLDDTRYSSKIAISWCSCLATSRWWWIHNSSSDSSWSIDIISHMPFPRCWRLFQKIPAYVQIQIVYALSPRDPDCLHWPLICQDLLMDPWTLYKASSLHPDPRIKTLSGWVKVTKVTETWECCSFELWMIRGTRPKLPSLDAAVSPRQGDDGYIIDHRYHEYLTNMPFPRCWRLFRKRSRPLFKIVHAFSPRDPDCLHWPLICQDLLMDPWTL